MALRFCLFSLLLGVTGCGLNEDIPRFDPSTFASNVCTVDQRVEANTCVACPDGTENQSGDDPLGSDTTCTPISCLVNERVLQNQCAPCLAGQRNVQGDDASGEDTTCDPVLCRVDERVLDNTCVQCSKGERNAQGDDASGEDTTCDPVLCRVDERVLDNTCEPCPASEQNDAGDDASGENTLCDDECVEFVGLRCDAFNEAYIKPTEPDGVFGWSVALDGDTLAVGSVGSSVRIFVRGDSQWTQQALLRPPDSGDFGGAVALHGDTLVVGAKKDNRATTGVNSPPDAGRLNDSGAVYVYVREGTQWAQQAYIKASNTGLQDNFGHSIALYEDTLAVGAFGEDSAATGLNGNQNDDSAQGSGAVYIFGRTSGQWTQQAYIKASNADAGDEFGTSLSLHKDRLAVGAVGEGSQARGVNGDQSDDSAQGSGAAYIFARQNNRWTQQAYIKASNTDSGDGFGASVSIHEDTLAVGAWREAGPSTGINGVQQSNAAADSGAAYVFVRKNDEWTQQAYIKASNTDAGDKFARDLALNKDMLVIGATNEGSTSKGLGGNQSDNTASSSGAAYVFARQNNQWTQQVYIKSPNTNENDVFGYSVALDDQLVAVGAPLERIEPMGAVYLRNVLP